MKLLASVFILNIKNPMNINLVVFSLPAIVLLALLPLPVMAIGSFLCITLGVYLFSLILVELQSKSQNTFQVSGFFKILFLTLMILILVSNPQFVFSKDSATVLFFNSFSFVLDSSKGILSMLFLSKWNPTTWIVKSGITDRNLLWVSLCGIATILSIILYILVFLQIIRHGHNSNVASSTNMRVRLLSKLRTTHRQGFLQELQYVATTQQTILGFAISCIFGIWTALIKEYGIALSLFASFL